MRRGLIISDLHCGSVAGLTPPGFMRDDLRHVQEVFWKWYLDETSKYGPYDFLICNGDMVDGEGKKGTLDTAMTDVRKQAEVAEEILAHANVPSDYTFLVRGSPFHTNGSGEYEDKIADDIGCSIKDTQKIEVEGWKIHSRHVVGRSDIPYGQATPLLKELARVEAEAFRDAKDAPDIIIRGHVHYSCFTGKHGRIAIDCPCLCLQTASANGRRYMAWEYDVGFGVLELDQDYEPIYHPVIMPMHDIREERYECVRW